jgi:Glycosyltransferase
VHFVGPIGYREPGYLWKLDLPYMWGPVGGTKNYPLRLSPKMKQTTRLRYLLRNGINFIQFRLNPRLRKVVGRCDLLLTATTETQQKFLSILGKDSVYLPENGITHIDKNRKPRCTEDKKKGLELIFIGRIDGGKNLVMLIDSLLKLKNPGNVHLTVVGDGPERESLMRYSEMCGLDGNVEWCGQIGRENVIDKLSMSDMLVITSIGEGNPTTIWEAMSCGVPTLTLDHCGMHDTICDECGFKVDINRKYSEITAEIASIIDRCSDNPGIIEEKRIGTERCAEKYMWDKRENILLDCYDMAISKFNAGG